MDLVEGRIVGLYAISTDRTGERSFTYWRGEAPARELFSAEGHEALAAALGTADLVYFTGVSLAILPDEGRERLISAVKAARDKGVLVAVDPNLRLNLWSSAEARKWLSAAYGAVSLVLTSEEEERALFGTGSFVERLNAAGCRHIVARRGPAGARYWHGDSVGDVPAVMVEDVVDTTGAGDAFNAGYLAAMVSGLSPEQAATAGCKLAATVIRSHGAVIPKEAMPHALLNQ